MKLILILGVLAFIAYVVIQRLKESGQLDEFNSPVKKRENIGKYYYLRKSLFTPTEYTFFKELQKQNNNQYIIHSKVRLEDIVGVAKGVGDRFREMRNHIKSRHVDFILIGNNGEVVAIIELDDKSHDTKNAQVGDEIKNQIFEFNKVKFYRIRVGEDFTHTINNLFTEIKGA